MWLKASWPSFWKSCLPSDLTVSIQAHSRVMLCNTTLVQEAARGCSFLTVFLLLLCLWEQLGGNSVTMKFWVALTHTTGSVLGGGTCMNWVCVGGITQIRSLRKHDRHQAEGKKRKKSILRAAWLPDILLLEWECRPEGCSKEHLPYAHPAVLYTRVLRPRDFGTCCWRLYPVEHYMSFLFWNLLMD